VVTYVKEIMTCASEDAFAKKFWRQTGKD